MPSAGLLSVPNSLLLADQGRLAAEVSTCRLAHGCRVQVRLAQARHAPKLARILAKHVNREGLAEHGLLVGAVGALVLVLLLLWRLEGHAELAGLAGLRTGARGGRVVLLGPGVDQRAVVGARRGQVERARVAGHLWLLLLNHSARLLARQGVGLAVLAGPGQQLLLDRRPVRESGPRVLRLLATLGAGEHGEGRLSSGRVLGHCRVVGWLGCARVSESIVGHGRPRVGRRLVDGAELTRRLVVGLLLVAHAAGLGWQSARPKLVGPPSSTGWHHLAFAILSAWARREREAERQEQIGERLVASC